MALTPHQAAGKKLGAFELLREVSASSVGATFVARSKDRPESVVLTKIHRHVAKSAQLCENLLSEAKRAAGFTDANVCEVLECGTIDGEPFVTHAWTESESLLSLLRRAGPDGLPLPIATRIALDIASAVHAAHDGRSFGHGELGPWCAHVGADGVTRTSGFAVDRAIARFGLHFAKNLDRLPYASPERVKPMSLTLGPPPPAPDVASDVFGVAVMAWELLARNKLFASRMEAAVVQKVLSAAIPDLKSQRAEVPEALSSAIARALTRDATQRGSTADLCAALREAEPATVDEVHEFSSRLVEKSQVRATATNVSGVSRAFSSVAPGPPSQRPAAPKAEPVPSNGDASKATNGATSGGAKAAVADGKPKPPLRPRATTLMGMPRPPAVPKDATPIDEEPTLDLRSSATELRDSSIEIMVEEPSTQDGNDLVVESTTVDPPRAAAKAPSVPPPPPPKTPSVPAPPMAARRKPPPRQHTLMGIEPLALVEAAPASDDVVAQGATTPSPAPNATKPAEAAAPDAPKESATDIAAGLVLAGATGSYQLIDAVARGGMATVWASRRVGAPGASDLFAVKTMLAELSEEADFATMFMDEVRVASKIEHVNVARSLDCVSQSDAVFLVMEWIDGDTLGALQNATRASGGIPENILVRITRGICAGLHAAHDLKDDEGALLEVVHRDVNPTNLMITRAGVPKIVDFGIAKSKGRVHVTRVGSTVKGKTPYLSPEQLGGLPIDRRSDLFSLGCVLYTMTTGVHPFRGESELRTIENIVLKTPANPRGLAPELHPEFERLILQLLEKEPKKRPESAAAVERELEKLEALLAKPATDEDVAKFIERALAEPLRERDTSIEQAAAKLDAKTAPPKAPIKPVARPAEPAANEPAADPTVDESAPVAPQAIIEALPLDLGPAPPPSPAPADEANPLAAQDALADAPAFPSPSAEVDELPGSSQRKPGLSQWARLTILVVVGVLAGIAIIAVIESTREKPDARTTPTVTATVTAAPTPPPATTPAPTPTPTPTETTPPPEPTATASETAAPTATETAAPTAAPTPDKPLPPRPPTKPPTFKPPKFNPTTL